MLILLGIIRSGLQAQRYISLEVFDFPPPLAINHLPQVREKLSAFPNCILLCQETIVLGFPGGAVVENLPANAGDTGSSPGLGKSYMPRNNWAREPQLLSLRVWSLCSATREAAIVRGPRTTMKSGPCLPQLEKALAQRRRPNTAKNIN